MKPSSTPLHSEPRQENHQENTRGAFNDANDAKKSPKNDQLESEALANDLLANDLLANDLLVDSTHTHHAHHDTLHKHEHSEASLRKLVNRLSRLEGHIRGIKTMVQENRPCPDVLIQVAAVRGGLDRVARVILDEHLNECITRAVDEGNIAAEVDALKAALDRFIS